MRNRPPNLEFASIDFAFLLILGNPTFSPPSTIFRKASFKYTERPSAANLVGVLNVSAFSPIFLSFLPFSAGPIASWAFSGTVRASSGGISPQSLFSNRQRLSFIHSIYYLHFGGSSFISADNFPPPARRSLELSFFRLLLPIDSIFILSIRLGWAFSIGDCQIMVCFCRDISVFIS